MRTALLARLRSAVRRAATTATENDPTITTEAFTIDLAMKRVHKDGGELHLTPTEWGILEILVRNQGKPSGSLGPQLPRPDPLPARLPRSTAPQARTRPVDAPLPHHRTRHGLPLHLLTTSARAEN